MSEEKKPYILTLKIVEGHDGFDYAFATEEDRACYIEEVKDFNYTTREVFSD